MLRTARDGEDALDAPVGLVADHAQAWRFGITIDAELLAVFTWGTGAPGFCSIVKASTAPCSTSRVATRRSFGRLVALHALEMGRMTTLKTAGVA